MKSENLSGDGVADSSGFTNQSSKPEPFRVVDRQVKMWAHPTADFPPLAAVYHSSAERRYVSRAKVVTQSEILTVLALNLPSGNRPLGVPQWGHDHPQEAPQRPKPEGARNCQDADRRAATG